MTLIIINNIKTIPRKLEQLYVHFFHVKNKLILLCYKFIPPSIMYYNIVWHRNIIPTHSYDKICLRSKMKMFN